MASNSLSMTLLALLALLVSSASAAEEKQTFPTAMSLFESKDKITLAPSALAVVAITVGAAMCLAGYRLFRIAIFLCGFIVGGVLISSLVEYLFKTAPWMVKASWIGFVVGGLLLGLLTMSLYKLSLFIGGAAGGVLLAFTIQTSVAYRFSPNSPNTVLVILVVVLGLVGGILALKLEKPVLVIATSFVGAVILAWGIGYFGGNFPNGADLKHYKKMNLEGDKIITIPGSWWGYLGLIVAATLLGIYVQFHKTGRGRHHKGDHDEMKTSQNAANRV